MTDFDGQGPCRDDSRTKKEGPTSFVRAPSHLRRGVECRPGDRQRNDYPAGAGLLPSCTSATSAVLRNTIRVPRSGTGTETVAEERSCCFRGEVGSTIHVQGPFSETESVATVSYRKAYHTTCPRRSSSRSAPPSTSLVPWYVRHRLRRSTSTRASCTRRRSSPAMASGARS